MGSRTISGRSSSKPESLGRSFNRVATSLLVWGRGTNLLYPWRLSNDPYKVFIAEVLLKRTTGKAVARIYTDFLMRYPGFEDLYSARDLESALAPLGLNRQRAMLLREAARHVLDRYGGRLPCDRTSLLGIPGVGEYIADAVLCFAFKLPALPIDSNVTRVVSRVFGSDTSRSTVSYYTRGLMGAVGPGDGRRLSWATIDLGRVVCRPLRPLCGSCPLNGYCQYVKITSVKQGGRKKRPQGKT